MAKYAVKINFCGSIQFHVEAEHESEAQTKAEDMFDELSSADVVRAICEVDAEDAIEEE